MKWLLLLTIYCVLAFTLYAQEEQYRPDSSMTFKFVKQLPEPTVDINSFLSENLCYPKDANRKNIQGRVIIKFIVDTTGDVIYPVVIKSIYPSIDSEAIRVIKLIKWKPGENDGQKVKVYFTLPINFRLT